MHAVTVRPPGAMQALAVMDMAAAARKDVKGKAPGAMIREDDAMCLSRWVRTYVMFLRKPLPIYVDQGTTRAHASAR